MANNLDGFESDEQDDYEDDTPDNMGNLDDDFNEFAMKGFGFSEKNSEKGQSNMPKKPDISIPFENINIGDIITVVAAPLYEVPTGLTGFTMKEDTLLHNNIMLVTSLELPFIGVTNFSRSYTDVGYEKLVFNGYSEYKFVKLSDKFIKGAMYATRYKDLDKCRKEALKNAK